MSVTTDKPYVLLGLMPRKDFAAEMDVCERTTKRWEDQGRIVVVHLGNQRLVDVEKSLARLRGEDRPRRGRGAK
jgi:predicted site-specific integrase-resolvase